MTAPELRVIHGDASADEVAAIERGIEAAGRVVWSRERPVVLVTIISAPPGADPISMHFCAGCRSNSDHATASCIFSQARDTTSGGSSD